MVTNVVRGLLNFTGILNCRVDLIMTLVFTLFGVCSDISVRTLVAMYSSLLSLRMVVVSGVGLRIVLALAGQLTRVLKYLGTRLLCRLCMLKATLTGLVCAVSMVSARGRRLRLIMKALL